MHLASSRTSLRCLPQLTGTIRIRCFASSSLLSTGASGFSQRAPAAVEETRNDQPGVSSSRALLHDQHNGKLYTAESTSRWSDDDEVESRFPDKTDDAPQPSSEEDLSLVLVVKNLTPEHITERKLSFLFSRFGPVRTVRLSQSGKSAYITFEDPADTVAASSSTFFSFAGQKLAWHLRKPSTEVKPTYTLSIDNISDNTNVEAVANAFSKVAELWFIRKAHDQSGRQHPGLFVDFASPEEARKVFETHRIRPFRFGRKAPKIRYARPTVNPRANDVLWRGEGIQVKRSDTEASANEGLGEDTLSFRRSNSPSRFIKISNIPHWMTRNNILDLFEVWGEVKGVKIGYWAERVRRALCTVEFKHIEDAKALMDAHQRYSIGVQGKNLDIVFCKDPTKLEPPPYRVLRVAGFTGGQEALETLFSKYGRYIKKMHVLPASRSVVGLGWGIGFVEFHTTEHATLAREQFLQYVLDDGKQLQVTYAQMPKQQGELAGYYGQDHGGEEYAFALSEGEYADSTQRREEGERGRFDFRLVDWEEPDDEKHKARRY